MPQRKEVCLACIMWCICSHLHHVGSLLARWGPLFWIQIQRKASVPQSCTQQSRFNLRILAYWRYMTLGRCPWSIFCSRGTPPSEVPISYPTHLAGSGLRRASALDTQVRQEASVPQSCTQNSRFNCRCHTHLAPCEVSWV